MRNISVKYFEFGPVVQDKMWFKDISYLEFWRPFRSVEQNHFCNSFGRGHHDNSVKLF